MDVNMKLSFSVSQGNELSSHHWSHEYGSMFQQYNEIVLCYILNIIVCYIYIWSMNAQYLYTIQVIIVCHLSRLLLSYSFKEWKCYRGRWTGVYGNALQQVAAGTSPGCSLFSRSPQSNAAAAVFTLPTSLLEHQFLFYSFCNVCFYITLKKIMLTCCTQFQW